MTTKHHPRVFLILLCALLAPGGPLSHAADAPRQIMWKDLVPPLPADYIFPKLSKQQALQLIDIADVRDRKARGEKIGAIELEDEHSATRKLEQAGFDVDGMLAKRKELVESSRQRARSVNAVLDGETVRMPGYLLPLEFSGKEVTEFLLVPYVGACIHTPPPPPNQIVHVKPDKPVANVTVFAPIWVTGRMSTISAKKSLSLVDGAADIDVGYSMRASLVEPYKE
jgi:hypothetical protein